MRLGGQRRSRNIEDRRRARASGGSTGGASRLRIGGRGGLPIAGVVIVLLIVAVVAGPEAAMRLVGEVMGQAGGPVASTQSTLPAEMEAEFEDRAARVLGSTEEVWTAIYRERGITYREPTLVFFTGMTRTACGFGSAAAGPFYCPPDEKLYIDLSFFQLMEDRLSARGDAAQAYVIAHEVGHHIQQIEGVLDWSMRAKQATSDEAERNRIQVRVELMADCYAGVWANRAESLSGLEFETGDIEEAIRAAEAVGDDTLMRNAGRAVVPDAFTHGTSAQRMRWFRRGNASGDPAVCETRELAYERL